MCGRNSFQVDTLGLKAPDGELRQTPPGQPGVQNIIAIGAVVKTNYGSGPYRVKRIDSAIWKGHRYWNLVCEGLTDQREAYLNELVAVDGRIVALFPNNDDEVLLVNTAGQLTLI